MIWDSKTQEFDFVRKFGGGVPKKAWLELHYGRWEGYLEEARAFQARRGVCKEKLCGRR